MGEVCDFPITFYYYYYLVLIPSPPPLVVVPIIIVKIRRHGKPELAARMPAPPVAMALVVGIIFAAVVAVTVVVIPAVGTYDVPVGDHAHTGWLS